MIMQISCDGHRMERRKDGRHFLYAMRSMNAQFLSPEYQNRRIDF